MNLIELCEKSETWKRLTEIVTECEFSSTPVYIVSEDPLVTLGTVNEIIYHLGYKVKKESLTGMTVEGMPIEVVSNRKEVPKDNYIIVEELQ